MNRTFFLKHMQVYEMPAAPDRTAEISQVEQLLAFFSVDIRRFSCRIMDRKRTSDVVRGAVFNALNLSLSGSSLSSLRNEDELIDLLSALTFQPQQIRTAREGYEITQVSSQRASLSGSITALQRQDVENFASSTEKLKVSLSTGGATDVSFSDFSAGADGVFDFDGHEGYLSLRYGTTSGGSQNDRFRTTVESVRHNKDRLFLVIHDGPEVLAYIEKYEESLGKENNVIVATPRMLPLVPWEGFVRRKKNMSQWWKTMIQEWHQNLNVQGKALPVPGNQFSLDLLAQTPIAASAKGKSRGR